MSKYTLEEIPGGVTVAQGFQAAGIHSGVKRQKKDLSLVFSSSPCHAAATYTTNLVQAAPLQVTREHIAKGPVRAVVINSGNANACTGQQGYRDALQMTKIAARATGVQPHEVLVASTGVIGVALPMDKIERGIHQAAAELSRDGGIDAALGIMTTDTCPKEAAVLCQLGENRFVIGAMAKGSGMIHPNMATMLAFITTDARVEPTFLQQVLREVVDDSFNMISVDGDTSTNDMVVLMANGQAGTEEIVSGTELGEAFRAALRNVCIRLARMIARDGEGATKLVEVRALGAKTKADARRVVRSISTSLLVKTAIYGEDANWGRILCAAGYSGADFNPDETSVKLGPLTVFAEGRAVPFDESKAKDYLSQSEVSVEVHLGAGTAEATGWTCDLTYDYVRINGSYRT